MYFFSFQGLDKRKVLKDILPLIGENLNLQRLFTEYHDQLECVDASWWILNYRTTPSLIKMAFISLCNPSSAIPVLKIEWQSVHQNVLLSLEDTCTYYTELYNIQKSIQLLSKFKWTVDPRFLTLMVPDESATVKSDSVLILHEM